MGNCVTDWVFRRQRFCCCLPARLGAAILALLTLLLSGLIMVILWFEVDTNYFMSSKEKTAFILAGVLETLLFIASVLGFIGTCARKQSFVVVFAVFLYVHFLINFGVAAYFLWMVTHTANKDIVKLCQEGLRNQQTKDQCTGLLNITKNVYWAISILVLAIEAYCALVVTRYVNQLRYEKGEGRRSRLAQRQSAYEAFHSRFSSVDGLGVSEAHGKHYSSLSGVSEDLEMDKEGLLNAPHVTPFDPYTAYDPHARNYSPGVSRTPSPSREGTSAENLQRVERHRNAAERQLTSASVEQTEERGRSSEVLALPPGAARPVSPLAAPHSPPPSYHQ